MPKSSIVNKYADKIPIQNTKKIGSDLQILMDDVSSGFNALINPNINIGRTSFKGTFDPRVDVGWDPSSGGLTPFGSPTVNPNFGGRIRGDYKLADNITLSGGANFGSAISDSPSTQPFWGGLKINLQNSGEVDAPHYRFTFGGPDYSGHPMGPPREYLLNYIQSDKYLERLGIEFPNYSQEQIIKERDKRASEVKTIQMEYPPSIDNAAGLYYHGANYIHPKTKKQVIIDPKIEIEHHSFTGSPWYTELHELSHAADKGGHLIPQTTKNLLKNVSRYQKPPEPGMFDYNRNYLGYVSHPTEVIARIQTLRGKLDKANIYNPQEDFTEEHFDKLIKKPHLFEDRDFKDLYWMLKGGDDVSEGEEKKDMIKYEIDREKINPIKKQSFIELMNKIAMQDDSSKEVIKAQTGLSPYTLQGKADPRLYEGIQIPFTSQEIKDIEKTNWFTTKWNSPDLNKIGLSILRKGLNYDKENKLGFYSSGQTFSSTNPLRKYTFDDRNTDDAITFMNTRWHQFINPSNLFKIKGDKIDQTTGMVRGTYGVNYGQSGNTYMFFDSDTGDFKASNAFDYVKIHEDSHKSDRGLLMPGPLGRGTNLGPRLITQYEQKWINDNLKTNITLPEDRLNYFIGAEGTEIRARVNGLRYYADKFGIWDVYNEFPTKKEYEELKQKIKEINPGSNPLKDLQQIYEDDTIYDSLFNISSIEDLPNIGDPLPEIKSAQLGGPIKYQTKGSVQYNKYKEFVKSQEASDAVMKQKPSLILKPDGKTYYKALEDGKYYPYADAKGKVTIGYGRTNSAVKGLNILNDYKGGITIQQANDFLDTDIISNYKNAKRHYDFGFKRKGIDFKGFGEGEFEKLSEREKYMITDYSYNLGYIYPKFSGALKDNDFETALAEYKRYSGKKELGRNKHYLDAYLNPWVIDTKEDLQKQEIKKQKDLEKSKKDPYSSVGKIGWFNLPDMGITEALFGFQDGGNVDESEKTSIIEDIQNLNIEVDAFAKEYVQSENFRNLAKRSGYKDRQIDFIIRDVMRFDPNKNITYDIKNPSAGMAYNPQHITSSGDYSYERLGPGFFDEGITNINYNPEKGPPHHPFFNLWEQIVAHEGGHLGFMENKLSRKTRKKLKKLIYPGTLDNTYDNLRAQGHSHKVAKHAVEHAKDPYELRANLFQLRYQLQKDGIYNSLERAVDDDKQPTKNIFTIDHLKQIMELDDEGNFKKYKDKYQNEFLHFVHPQDIIWMMNNIAQEPSIQDDLPEGTMRAQQGGSIKGQNGIDLTTKEVTLPADKTFVSPQNYQIIDESLPTIEGWNISEIGHGILDFIGLAPVIGEVVDLVNAAWYAAEGDNTNALLSAGAAIPFLGWGSTGGKFVNKVTGKTIDTSTKELKFFQDKVLGNVKSAREANNAKLQKYLDSPDIMNLPSHERIPLDLFNKHGKLLDDYELVRTTQFDVMLDIKNATSKSGRKYTPAELDKLGKKFEDLNKRSAELLEQMQKNGGLQIGDDWHLKQIRGKNWWEDFERGGPVKKRQTKKYQTQGNVITDENKGPDFTDHYIFNTEEGRNLGLTGAPPGTAATLIWGSDEALDSRVLYGRQPYPVAIYADGIYQGVLNPGQKLYTDPAMRIDELPLGYTPSTEILDYFASVAPAQTSKLKNKYNTELDDDDKALYEIFKKQFDIKEGSEDDIDLQGIFKSGKYKDLEGFSDEKFRKPNHPLFTKKSIYHNQDGNIGGDFNSEGAFEPSKTNMKYNNVDMLLTALSSSGGKLALAPYFQKIAPTPTTYETEYQKNYDELVEARHIKETAEFGGEVYNQMSNKIRSLVKTNTKLRSDLEAKQNYQSKVFQNGGLKNI